PRVGLLNVGQEESKGGEVVREAALRLAADGGLNYRGFVEGDGIYSGDFDIIVCDGFVGNVALKSSEGVARMIATLLRDSLSASLAGRLGALLARRALARFAVGIAPGCSNVSSLLGLDGSVGKSHGRAGPACFAHALDLPLPVGRQQLPSRIARYLPPAAQ